MIWPLLPGAHLGESCALTPRIWTHDGRALQAARLHGAHSLTVGRALGLAHQVGARAIPVSGRRALEATLR